MPEKSQLIVGLEAGTSKVCAVVGELGANDALNIIAIGQSRSRGVRKGEIVDPAVAEDDIRNAIVEAEQMADVEIRSVFLGTSGAHIRGFTNRGVHPVVSADREITDDDVQDVVKNAKAINLPAENNIIHAIRQHFIVDGHGDVKSPIGLLGARLEVDLHVVHGSTNRLQNSIRAVKSLGIVVEDVVFNGLASSLATLSADQKELGALVLDIGGGVTDYAVYSSGVIKHTGVLAVGGDHITSDLAIGLKVPLGRAEQLKIEHGAAVVDGSVAGKIIELPSEVGLPARQVNLEHLRRIMSLRCEEILELIAQDLDQAGLLPWLGAGVVLCGGGARIPQIEQLATQVFGVPATLGRANTISGLKSALDQPEFAAGIGLVKFGSMQARRPAGRSFITDTVRDVWKVILRR
ncbi:MAG: cell division protein FtsA [Verrucomicrobia bacterium]|nr:cell division protein FtsA [Verrucomicrobiota bacterium]